MLLLIKLDEACPKKKDKTLTKHLRLRGLLGVREDFHFRSAKKVRVLRDFVVVVVVVSDGFSTPFMPFTLVTLVSLKTFVGFPFFGRPKNHSSATCQIESATEPGQHHVWYVYVYTKYIYDCPILHNSTLSSCFMNGEPSSE